MNYPIEVGCPNPDCYETFWTEMSDEYTCPHCAARWLHDDRFEPYIEKEPVGC